jgi:hypothetical protein
MAERRSGRNWDKLARQKRQERADRKARELRGVTPSLPSPGVNIPQRAGACPDCRGDVVWLANRDKWQCLRESCRQSFPGWDISLYYKKPS